MNQRTRIHRLFIDRAQALQVFFRRRLRHGQDARDLIQELYLRLLRAGEQRPIFNPEAYLFTVANNLLKERHVMRRREARPEAQAAEVIADETDLDTGLDQQVHRRWLRTLLPELSARTRLVLFLAFEEELSYSEIASRLGVSKSMVQKIVTQAIAYCRKRMAELEVQ